MRHLELQIKDFGQQFTDQIKSLDSKVSIDGSILSNILDLYKRRATIEQDYAENLLKLSSSISQRNNLENLRRPKWKNYSPVKVLNCLLASTEHTARAHKNLGDIYGKQMTQRVVDMQEDCSRLTKRSTEILQRRHSEIVQLVNQLLLKQKNYVKLFNDANESKRKIEKILDQLNREVVRSLEKKKEFDNNPKIRKLRDEYTEKYKLYKEKHVASHSAKNKYIIHLESLKESIRHFYTKELDTIYQCAQYGFHNNLTRLCLSQASCEEAILTVHSSISNLFAATIVNIDVTNDTDVFFEAHKAIFTEREPLYFLSAKDDNIDGIKKIEQKIENDLKNMHVKFDADAKTLSTAMLDGKSKINELSKIYTDLISQADYDVVDYVCYQSKSDQSVKERSASMRRDSVVDCLYSTIQRRIKECKLRKEVDYFKLMEVYLNDQINSVSVAKKLKIVEVALSTPIVEDNCDECNHLHQQTLVMVGLKSKLFGGDLKRLSLDTKELVPLIVRSCIRLINLYGMHNVGVFRVPGSQIEVQTCKTRFEQNGDPIKDLAGTPSDVTLAASLLKLFFRELDPPIFDERIFTKIVEKCIAAKQEEEAIVELMKEIVAAQHPAVYATVTYLVSFIGHLAEYSKDNCMDVLNLAMIFGPCLMPIPDDKDSQLFHYQSIVNHVTQCIITFREQIFTSQSAGHIYQREQSALTRNASPKAEPMSVQESDKYCFFGGSIAGSLDEDSMTIKGVNAVAISDYDAIMEDELSLVSGDLVLLSKRINEQWWSGCMTESKSLIIQGLIPNCCIRILPDDDEQLDENEPIGHLQRESNISPSDCQNVPGKKYGVKNISLVSLDSDIDLEFNSRNGTSQNPSTENTPDFSDTGESKSVDSIGNFLNIEVTQHPLNIENEAVKIRSGSLLRSSELLEAMDIFDDDLKQTMQGLQKIEQLNVINYRSTIHIDESLLASKFISPLRTDLVTFYENDEISSPVSPDTLLCQRSAELDPKRPENVLFPAAPSPILSKP